MLLKQAALQRLLAAGVKFQLIVTKTSAAPVIDKCAVIQPGQNITVANIISPTFVDPTNAQQFNTVVNPDILNPDITNATVALAPGDTARVTLRVFSPTGDGVSKTNKSTGTGGGDAAGAAGGGPFSATEVGAITTPDAAALGGTTLDDLTGALRDLAKLGVASTSHPVDTVAADAGSTTPDIEASIPLIVTTTLPDGARLQPYTATIDTAGTTVPYSIAIVTGALPPGLTLTPTTGAIFGTPTASGTFTFTAQLTNTDGATATATLTIRVFEPIVVATSALPGVVVNQLYSAPVTAAGGFPPHTWAVTGGSLPSGVTLTGAGVLTGTPTQSGTFTFTATATDSAAPTRLASASLTLNVTPTANARSATVAEDAPTAIALTGTGAANASFVFSIVGQPAHGALTGAGPTFTYTPASNYNGPDSFTFRVTQGALPSAPATVSITVTATNDAPTAKPATVETPQGQPISFVVTGTDPENSTLAFSIVAGTGPTHGTQTGTLPNVTYTPAAAFQGNDTFTFRVTDPSGLFSQAPVTIIVGPPPAGSADVSVTLADAPDPVALGGNVTYTATVHNNGPAPAANVTLTLAYPAADLKQVSVTPSQGTCAVGNPIMCTLGTLGFPGTNATVAVSLKAFNHGGAVTTTAAVSATPLDYNTTNNSASQSTTVSGPAAATTDLLVTQSRAPNPVAFGAPVTYTIVVTNNGPSDATGVTLNNAFTASTAAFVSSTASQGACVSGPGQIGCNVGSLASGGSATYAVTLNATGAGSLTNTATVAGAQADPAAGNNSNATSTTISNRDPSAVNDVATTNEDTSTSVSVLGNDTDPDGDTLSVTIATQPTHGNTTVNGNNTVTYSPAPNYNGPDSFSYTISDGHGGTATATVSVAVLAVNDAPSFTKGPDQSAATNSGAQTVPGWATAISAGPADESGQFLTFIVSNTNHSLFSAQPLIAPNGTLTYSLAPNTTGTSTVTVVLQDDGGTANGGIDTSAAQTFTITVTAVNDAPSFTKGADQTVHEDAGPQTVPGWATAISAGPANESGQTLNFIVSNNNTALFSAQPAIAANGTLTYTPAANANGSAT